MRAILFDLDDTLYPEIEFVKSGFKVVARYLSSRYWIDEVKIMEEMSLILEKEGRGKVFDRLLQNLDIFTPEKVNLLVYLYRSHLPNIALYDDVMPVIKALKNHNILIGLLTDGMASVQQNKVNSLGINRFFDIIIYTDKLGKDLWKPSPVPYKIALDLLNLSPQEAAYVGDNPAKDFISPNRLGMKTIQIKRHQQDGAPAQAVDEMNPNFVIREFNEILSIIV